MTSTNEIEDQFSSLQVEDDNDEEESDEAATTNDAHFNGCWMILGFNGMVMTLDEIYSRELSGEDEEKGQECMDFSSPPEYFIALADSKNLSIADCVIRRYAEGHCPSRIPITRLSERDMDEISTAKRQGNQAFQEGLYEKAIELYEEALFCVLGPMLISPSDQQKEVVAVLSNTAECHLRLRQYSDAGQIATQALLLDSGHEKSRIRRAKAEIVLAAAGDIKKKSHYLVQAWVDIQTILEDRPIPASASGVSTALKMKQDVENRLKKAKKRYLAEHPKADWELVVRVDKSTCW